MGAGQSATYHGLLEELKNPHSSIGEGARDVQLYLDNFSMSVWNNHGGGSVAGADRIKAFKWVLAELVAIENGHKENLGAVKKFLANARAWDYAINPHEPCFYALHHLAEDRLCKIMRIYEQHYISENLGARIGMLGQGISGNGHPRQDQSGLLPTPSWNWNEGSGGVLTSEQRYLWTLVFFAVALQPIFDELVTKIGHGSGALVRTAPVKSFGRMEGKLGEDHSQEPSPKGACNLDTNRCAITHDSPEGLIAAFEQAEQLFGAPIRVKNHYHPNFDGNKTKGYRAILANYNLQLNRTWGELFQAPGVREGWDSMFDEHTRVCDPCNVPYFQLMHRQAVDWMLSPEVMNSPVSVIVEIQFMTKAYLAMRKKIHLWYQIYRAEHQVQLCMDFRNLTTKNVDRVVQSGFRGITDPQ